MSGGSDSLHRLTEQVISKMNTATENVDPAEVAKFDALASRWWDTEGEFRPLHQINPLRLDWIRQHVDLSEKRSSTLAAVAAS